MASKSKRLKRSRGESDSFDSSLTDDEVSFSVANELGGGFLSLEEIDEADYGLGIPLQEIRGKNPNLGKGGEKLKKKRKLKKNENEEPTDSMPVEECDETIPGDPVDESEYYGWSELRLHSLLMKSIYRLKFKEPTPIQKECILAAAHRGKDVIGAAETGSGKTLAFGSPIIQRLLEERDKAENQITEQAKKVAPTSVLRALIITPTRELAKQVTDHLKKISEGTNIRVVSIVGGMSIDKQIRLLKARPEIVVGTPGRLWKLMLGGEIHLIEQHSLSFFVLDEADRLLEEKHYCDLQSIIDMLPVTTGSVKSSQDTENCVTVSRFQRKKRQTLVFSATIAPSSDFRTKLKRGSAKSKPSEELNSIETLSERAGMRADVAIIDLTNTSILVNRLEESFRVCTEEDKDGYLYYILSVHRQGRTIVFCTSIAAIRYISSLLLLLGIKVLTLHSQKEESKRLEALDRFKRDENAILVATDIVGRGIDIPGVRTVIHYQLPHFAEAYVHRCGRTARASADGCSVALISSSDALKFAALCKLFSKKSYKEFPVKMSYMSEVAKRLSLARKIDRIHREESQVKANKSWYRRSAESVDLIVENDESEEERVNNNKRMNARSATEKMLEQELALLLSRPLQPKSLSHPLLAAAAISPLEALRECNHEVSLDTKLVAEKRKNMNNLRRKLKDEKKCGIIKRESRRKGSSGVSSKVLIIFLNVEIHILYFYF